MKRITMLLGAGILLLSPMVMFIPSGAEGAVPQLINFQGILRDGSGNPVANGSYSVQFTIYDAATGGTNLWQETQSVNTVNGLFTVLLGSGPIPLDYSLFNDSTRWLGVKVGADPEMTPRQRLSSVGYSHNSSEWTSAAGNLFRLNGNVGVGTASPTAKLHVENSAGTGVYSSSSTGIGVWGEGITWGLYGNSTSGTGVVGSSSSGYGVSASGGAYGVYSTSSSGTGVYGEGTRGVYGFSAGGSVDNYGVYGNAFNSSGFRAFGVKGEASTNTGNSIGGDFYATSSASAPFGVYGTAYSPSSSINAYGGYFYATPSGGSGATYGVYGDAGSVGVYGSALSSGVYGTGGNYGVYGTSSSGIGVYGASSSGTGVYGYSGSGYGVYASGLTNGVVAVASASGGSGVYGSNGGNPSTYAGYFVGTLYTSGDFIAGGSKSAAVKTDNGEYRLLYAQEATENWFEDFGTAQLVNGRAMVTIEPTFAQTVNTAVAYHVFLTPEGDSRGLYVTGKTPTSFEIREQQNGKSELAVSYRIVAKRKGYENVRLAKLTGKIPEEVQAEDAVLRTRMAEEHAKHEQGQLKMEAQRKQVEEERAKMERERVIPEQKIKENK